jgi:hypothetical protein
VLFPLIVPPVCPKQTIAVDTIQICRSSSQVEENETEPVILQKVGAGVQAPEVHPRLPDTVWQVARPFWGVEAEQLQSLIAMTASGRFAERPEPEANSWLPTPSEVPTMPRTISDT